jgi:hypothetical protein
MDMDVDGGARVRRSVSNVLGRVPARGDDDLRKGVGVKAGAIRILVIAGLATVAGLALPAVVPPVRPGPLPGKPPVTDARTFEAVVDRVRGGEPYYLAMGAELRSHDYPARDPFNWRTPLHLSALAVAPWVVWRGILTAVLVAFYVAVMMTVRTRPASWVAGALTLGILVISAAPDAIFVSEAWAGALIGLSASAFTLERRPVGVGLAIVALFIRELAAPYCVLCTVMATAERRWREVSAWALGALAYAGYYAWHVMQVFAHRIPTDFSHGDSWLTFLGIPFLQATLLKLGWFALLPSWTSAIALGLLAAGLAAADTPRHIRAASAVFAGFFLIAGLPFNDYWGFLAAPVWAVTCGYGAGAVAAAAATLTASSSAPA